MPTAAHPLRLAAAVLVATALPALAIAAVPGEPSAAPPAATAPVAGCAAMGHGDMAGHHPAGAAAPGAAAGPLQLPGQDAFGALQEVVARLDADPATDWKSVNLRALRDHLVDMNELVLNAEVVETAVDGGFPRRSPVPAAPSAPSGGCCRCTSRCWGWRIPTSKPPGGRSTAAEC